MNTDEYEFKAGARRGRGSQGGRYENHNKVFYRTTTHHFRDGHADDLVRIVIGEELMHRLGWVVAGTRVCLMQSRVKATKLALVPDEERGLRLAPSSILPTETYDELRGRPVRAVFKALRRPGSRLPETDQTTVEVSDWTIDGEALILRLPRDGRFDFLSNGQKTESQ